MKEDPAVSELGMSLMGCSEGRRSVRITVSEEGRMELGSRVAHDVDRESTDGRARLLRQAFHGLVDVPIKILFPALPADTSRDLFNDFEVVSPPEVHGGRLAYHAPFAKVAGLNHGAVSLFRVRRSGSHSAGSGS